MSDGTQEQWATVRELNAVSERVTRMEAVLPNMLEEMRALREKSDQVLRRVENGSGSEGLAMHHLAQSMTKLADQMAAKQSSADPLLTMLAPAIQALSNPPKSGGSALSQVVQLIGAIAIGALSYRFLGSGL